MPKQFASYHRIHPGPCRSDAERSKIARETARATRAARRADRLSQDILTDRDPEDAALDVLAEETAVARREALSSKGHKRRLRVLLKDPDFV